MPGAGCITEYSTASVRTLTVQCIQFLFCVARLCPGNATAGVPQNTGSSRTSPTALRPCEVTTVLGQTRRQAPWPPPTSRAGRAPIPGCLGHPSITRPLQSSVRAARVRSASSHLEGADLNEASHPNAIDLAMDPIVQGTLPGSALACLLDCLRLLAFRPTCSNCHSLGQPRTGKSSSCLLPWALSRCQAWGRRLPERLIAFLCPIGNRRF